MNYYDRHIGDILKETIGLSMLEDGAYSRLLDQVYATEKPLPADKREVYREARATSAAERKAVDYVLGKFFTLTADGYVHERAQAHIEEYWDREPAEQNKRENAKIRQQRARERRKQLFEELRKHGVTPEFNASMKQLEAELSRVTKRDETSDGNASVTRDDTATQTPPPNPQSPLPIKPLDQPAQDLTTPGAGCSPGEISKAMRAFGINSNPADPRIIALAEQGVAAATITAACEEAKRSKPDEPIGPGLIVAIVERWAKKAKAIDASGAQPPSEKPQKQPQDAWWLNNAGIDRKGRELGMFARNGEDYGSFKDRIFARLREGGKAA